MSPDFDFNELENCLKDEDSFITKLIDTIPPKMYFDQDVQEKILADKHAHMEETVKGFQGSFSRNKVVSDKMKHKRARLDPHCQKLVSQIQEEISNTINKKKKKKVPFQSPSLARAENIEELQKRLQEKVSQLQAKRRGCSTQEFLEMKRMKKIRKKQKKAKGNFTKEKKVFNTENKPSKPVKQKGSPKPMYNKEGKVLFSKLEFNEDGREEKKKGKFSGKNYKKLLHNAEKETEKISKVREEDTKKAEELVHKKVWKRAIEKIEGMKVKDDPALLKKSLVHQEKMKRKSAKAWKDRGDHVEHKKNKQQDKRKRNIQSRKKEKLQAKLKRAKKKGRIIPGF